MTINDRYITKTPRDQSLQQLLAGLRPGQGVSVLHLPPYWDVLVRIKADTSSVREYIVVDSSLKDRKPQRVHGPVKTQEEATEWARSTQQLWLATHVFFATDEPGNAFI